MYSLSLSNVYFYFYFFFFFFFFFFFVLFFFVVVVVVFNNYIYLRYIQLSLGKKAATILGKSCELYFLSVHNVLLNCICL